MLQLFLFALVLGGGLLAVSVFSDHGDHDLDVHGGVAEAFKFLSLRTLIYFLFTFGGVGTALTLAWGGRWLGALIIAMASGVAVSGVASFIFRYIRATDSGAREGEDGFLGLPARITVPIGAGGVGKVSVVRGGRSYELLAKPFGTEEAAEPRLWQSVVIVEMQGGVALVAPVEELPAQVS
jgi:hypothetical protein